MSPTRRTESIGTSAGDAFFLSAPPVPRLRSGRAPDATGGDRAPDRGDLVSRLRLVVLVLGICALLGIFQGVQTYLNASGGRDPLTLAAALERPVRRYLIYAVLTFPCLWLCRRYPFTSRRWLVPLLAHLAGLAAFIVLYAVLRFVMGPAVVDPATMETLPLSWANGLNLIRSNLFEQFWMYTSMVTAILSIQHFQQLRRRELQEAELRRRMVEYELQVLKLQLHPHFLFNTLNGISALMLRDTRTAREMLLRLGDLLRVALARSQDNEVLLSDELDFVRAYLELEQMRFGERLRLVLAIAPETLDAWVPNMLIQPLVENAIQYGISEVRSGGSLELTTRVLDGQLQVRIVNDGPIQAIGPHSTRGSGLGLGNARLRLGQLYGDAYELHISARGEGGADLRLQIPLRKTG